ncbi:SusC/RagA family TonB-linked outer membrane protein [Galbibacter sp. EGI 63066]|uniref:SusC/RagA family TonB-linked outer membrane protein n=1 Tax=Galbibacter sp. EGI 63066 TaxID=2993559 RepID=UPI0022487C82|nr:SusC/RagA family TonB-linked outer membrane protein [Galbibacter sp. EGI 63066]MCX2679185.1 SusC/RagA family TonB-linked outer membrane protein [Galbibacter sp. EGI 63066]
MFKQLLPLMVLAFVLVSQSLVAQDKTITGTVTDANNGSPLPGVAVILKGTNNGTSTDFDGNYTINNVPDDGELVFSFIGYSSQEVTVQGRTTINVGLSESTEELGEVIVTAFGISQEKKALGYAAQSIDAESITETKESNLVSSLQGQVAGVQITNSGGAPGQSARIVIRGINSLNPSADNQPLFVIDGVPVDNSTVESPNTPRGLSNRAADINPADVESMSVLKGAAATALYGVRAANGAVIITTKKGEKGRVKINLNTSVGFEELNRLPELQKQYGQGFSGEYDPTSFWPSWGAPIDEVAQTEPGHKYQDNWNRAFNTGVQTDHSLSVSGGGDVATFYASLGRFDQEGIIPFSDWDRTTAKISGTVTASDKFSFGGSINFSNSGGNRVPHDRFMERMMYWAETQDVRDYINEDGTMRTYGNTNPIYDARFSTYKDDVNRIIGNLNFSYSPIDWLTLSYRIGTDFYSDSRTEITPGPKGIDGENPLSSTGFIEETRINRRDITSNFYITLNNKFGDDLTATLRLGNDIFERKYDRLNSTGSDFVIPEFYNLNNTNQVFTSQGKSIRRLVGFYGDLMLNYKEYLYLNLTGRNDITSTLPKDNNSFFYPSINLGYIFTEHLDMPTWFTFGKLRASWAQVGKDTDPHLLGATFVAPDQFPLGGQVGFSRNSSFGDPGLEPELTTSIEFGTQLSFFDSRLDLDIAYYKSNSEHMIFPVPISDATGFSSYITNAGEIENSGFEAVLGVDIIRSEDFNWTATANLSMNNNEVKAIREGIDEIVVGSQFGYVGSTVTMKLIEGEAYGNIYGSSYERYGPDEESIFLQEDLPVVIGDDGFPVRNGDQLILGNAIPKWIGGLKNELSYKNFELNFLIDFRADVDQYNQFDNFLSAFGKNKYSLARNDFRVFDGVLADGSPNTQEVWLGQGVGPDGRDYGAGYWRNAYRGVSENFVQDGSFIKLRNVSLAYNLDDRILSRLPFTSLRAAFSVNNIILYSPWDGFDPESFSAGAGGNAVGFTGLGYPGTQSYFLTLNFGL